MLFHQLQLPNLLFSFLVYLHFYLAFTLASADLCLYRILLPHFGHLTFFLRYSILTILSQSKHLYDFILNLVCPSAEFYVTASALPYPFRNSLYTFLSAVGAFLPSFLFFFYVYDFLSDLLTVSWAESSFMMGLPGLSFFGL